MDHNQKIKMEDDQKKFNMEDKERIKIEDDKENGR